MSQVLSLKRIYIPIGLNKNSGDKYGTCQWWKERNYGHSLPCITASFSDEVLESIR